MASSVELALRRAADASIPSNSSGLVAVSGGGDSVALLHLLVRLAAQREWTLHVAHLDHGLRRGSVADRRFVVAAAAALGLACTHDRRPVPDLRRRDESPEEAARRVRRAFLTETARATGASWIATGHTRDDQAETILMRLVRGAGATALTGMAPAGPGPFVRPLLGVEREALRRWLLRRRIDHREDPSNRDLRFDRNRVRRLVLPVLAESLNPRAAANLVRAAGRFREDAVYLDRLAEVRLDELARLDRRGRLAVDAGALAAEPGAVARRIVILALRRAGGDARRLGSRHVEAVLDLCRGGHGRETHLPGKRLARRDRERIRIGRRVDFE